MSSRKPVNPSTQKVDSSMSQLAAIANGNGQLIKWLNSPTGSLAVADNKVKRLNFQIWK